MKTDIESGSNLLTVVAKSQARSLQTPQTCSVCGAAVKAPRTSLRELMVNTLCGVVLLAILAPGFWLVEHWVDQQGQHMVNHFPWRERFEDW